MWLLSGENEKSDCISAIALVNGLLRYLKNFFLLVSVQNLTFWPKFFEFLSCVEVEICFTKYISTCNCTKVNFCTPFFAKFFYFLRFGQENLQIAYGTCAIFNEKYLYIYFGQKINIMKPLFKNLFKKSERQYRLSLWFCC